jgi:hypothetical protein
MPLGSPEPGPELDTLSPNPPFFHGLLRFWPPPILATKVQTKNEGGVGAAGPPS